MKIHGYVVIVKSWQKFPLRSMLPSHVIFCQVTKNKIKPVWLWLGFRNMYCKTISNELLKMFAFAMNNWVIFSGNFLFTYATTITSFHNFEQTSKIFKTSHCDMYKKKKCTWKNVYRKYKYNTIYLDFVKLDSEIKCYCCFILGDLLFHFLLEPHKGVMGKIWTQNTKAI